MSLFCIGDSLTFGYGVPFKEKWTTLLCNQMEMEVVNFGVNGDTTSGMLCRIQRLFAAWSPTAFQAGENFLFLMGGSNDIFFSGSDKTARVNMGAMVSQILAYEIRPLIGIPPPVCPEMISSKWAKLIDFAAASQSLEQYGRWLSRFVSTFDLQTVDFRSSFLDKTGRPRIDLFGDGIHPNAAGHQIMADRLRQRLTLLQGT